MNDFIICKCDCCGKQLQIKRKEWQKDGFNYSWEKAESQKKHICDECKGLKIVEMFYGNYKQNYSDCKTVKDSYNRKNKTIKVIIKEM